MARCANCGRDVPAGLSQCPDCLYPLGAADEGQAPTSSYENPPPPYEAYAGYGGWGSDSGDPTRVGATPPGDRPSAASAAPPAGYGPMPAAAPTGWYPAPNPYLPYRRGTNGLAIASLVCSIAGVFTCGLGAVLGVIFGHIALSQVKSSGEEGHGLALAGVIVGWVFIGLVAAYIILLAASNG